MSCNSIHIRFLNNFQDVPDFGLDGGFNGGTCFIESGVEGRLGMRKGVEMR